jgi:predicted lipid-binding transport protein (Tim44 family)
MAAGGVGSSGGGFFWIQILLVGALAFFLYRMYTRRKATSVLYDQNTPLAANVYSVNTNEPSSAAPSSVEEQIQMIKNSDRNFDTERFKEACVDQFFTMQAAWMNRDLTPIRGVMDEEIYSSLEKDVQKLKNDGQINRIESVAVRQTEIIEARQEYGKDLITLRFHANLLDYTVDEKTGEVVNGSKNTPVKFEEFWTYSRSGSSYNWTLSAIEQANTSLN